jgi:hypothetical protein
MMLGLDQKNKSIQLIIVKDLNLVFIVRDQKIEQTDCNVFFLLVVERDGVKVEFYHKSEE